MVLPGANDLIHQGQDYDTFKCTFVNENVRILIKISLKFAPIGPINNMPALALNNGLALTRQQAIIWTNGG